LLHVPCPGMVVDVTMQNRRDQRPWRRISVKKINFILGIQGSHCWLVSGAEEEERGHFPPQSELFVTVQTN